MNSGIKVHLVGFDSFIRDFDRTNDKIEQGLYDGTDSAANYLRDCIEDKFGTYQSRGGPSNGLWPKLKYKTIVSKRKKGNSGNATKPLVDYGDMMFSFDIQTSNRTRKHTATITSDDDKILYHIYGAPHASVPRRDPVRPTLEDERQHCFDIIVDAVKRRLGL
jgi:hypothetical protein